VLLGINRLFSSFKYFFLLKILAIENPVLVLGVGSAGLLVNLLGLFLFHGEYYFSLLFAYCLKRLIEYSQICENPDVFPELDIHFFYFSLLGKKN